jgi:thiamine pyrophosphokinase
MKAVIIANGNIKDYNYFSKIINQADLIICADGGANHLKKMDISPHVIIGDFDSMDLKNNSYYKTNEIKIIKHPSEKDETDTELAALFAIKQKCNDLTFIGATGTRLDHTLANIFLLKKIISRSLKKKIQCRILDDNNEIFLITDMLTIKKTDNCFVSLLPLSEVVEGVSTSGLKYPLNNARIKSGATLGISNQIIAEKATVSLKKGTLIVIKSKD